MFIRNGELVTILRVKVQIKNKLLKSLRLRLLILLVFMSLIPSLLIKSVLVEMYRNKAISWRTAEVQNQCTILSNQLANSTYLEDASSEVLNAEIAQLANIYDGRVFVIDEEFRVKKDTFDLEAGKTIIVPSVLKCFAGETAKNYDIKNHYVEVTTPITDLESKEIRGVILVSISADVILDTVDSMYGMADLIITLFLLLSVIIGAFVIERMFQPFRRLTKSIADVAEGYEDEDLSEQTYVETEMISDAINKMFGRMRILDESRQEFVSNVSHELKTPLTSMKVLADSLLTQEDVPVELYQEFMGDIAEEIERENKIINDLLSLVKMDKKAPDLNIQTENINELVERILKRLRPIAATRNIELVFESFRPIVAEVDEVKLSLAISNLVENAIKYNREEGWVHVSLNADHKYFFVKVADSGIGIPEEDVEHIFERFYRVDKSHSREIGGTGLGLAIARNAIVMHRGAIKVFSEEGTGTTFTVRVPLNYICGS